MHRTMHPPLDHAVIGRRVASVASGLLSPAVGGSLSLLLCSDRVIHDLNLGWLDRDKPTNVIAFSSPRMASWTDSTGPLPLDPGILDAIAAPDGPPIHIGDIAVSVDTARREQGSGGGDERVVYLAMHGLLHILGWEHGSPAQWSRMHRLTRRLTRMSSDGR
jgi:probable rRNA maturation factor